MDGDGFEPSKRVATDLQSAPFGHSGIHPNALTSIDYIITIMVKKQVVSLENITPRSKKIAYPG